MTAYPASLTLTVVSSDPALAVDRFIAAWESEVGTGDISSTILDGEALVSVDLDLVAALRFRIARRNVFHAMCQAPDTSVTNIDARVGTKITTLAVSPQGAGA